MESKIQVEIRQHAMNKWGCFLYRNNCGAVLNSRNQLVRFGLGNESDRINSVFKSSDLIGIWPFSGVGIFVAIETKFTLNKKDFRYKGQVNFINHIKHAGGIAGVVTSIYDLDELFETFINNYA